MYDKPISYSGKSLWNACPRLWHDNYILGNRQPSGPAADRGTRLHNQLEDFFKGSHYPSADKCLSVWQSFMEGLHKHSPTAEGEVAVTATWDPCSFNDPKAFFRGKKDLDIGADSRLMLFDWKSGKVYDDHHKQGEAYVALSPGYEDYDVYFVYLDQPLLVKHWSYNYKDREVIVDGIHNEVEAIRNATEYPAIPSPKCDWCHLSWRRGGDCKRAR